MEDQPARRASEESILGEIPVSATLALGAEHLQLFFTNKRLIVARTGKTGAAALATSSLLGRFGAGLDLLLGRKKPVGGPTMRRLTPEDILGRHKDNFEISYSDIIDVELAKGPNTSGITILTKNERLVLTTLKRFENVRGIFAKALGEKVRTGRLSAPSSERGSGRH